jgi:hypothetical protein
MFAVSAFWNFQNDSSKCFIIIGNIAHVCCCGWSLNVQETVVMVQSSCSLVQFFSGSFQIHFLFSKLWISVVPPAVCFDDLLTSD